jgi:hypothetical protein
MEGFIFAFALTVIAILVLADATDCPLMLW